MESLFSILKSAPWWAYISFGYLVRVGIKALKPQVLPINKMFILPLILVGWSLCSLIVDFRSWWDLAAWAISAIASYFLGAKLAVTAKKMKVDKKKLLLYMPGSRRILFLVLCAFTVKYLLGYFNPIRPATLVSIHLAGTLSSGAIAGFFVGRLQAFIKGFPGAKHQSLKRGGSLRQKSLL